MVMVSTSEYNHSYYETHKNKKSEYNKAYYKQNKSYFNSYRNEHKKHLTNYKQFYRWYDREYSRGLFHENELEYMRDYNALHRRRINEQIRQNKLNKNKELGSREIEILSNIKNLDELDRYLKELKKKYRI